MTQGDKKLLLQDLCARLPYNVIVRVEVNDVFIKPTDEVATTSTINMLKYPQKFRITPYLRSMSSMTEDEKAEIQDLYHQNTKEVFKDPSEIRGYMFYDISVVDWLNAHHFDYRGLISIGFALEAPNKLYD